MWLSSLSGAILYDWLAKMLLLPCTGPRHVERDGLEIARGFAVLLVDFQCSKAHSRRDFVLVGNVGGFHRRIDAGMWKWIEGRTWSGESKLFVTGYNY